MNLYIRKDSRARYPWPWVYFDGELEGLVDARCNSRRCHRRRARWEAPDLVGSDVPLEAPADGIHRVLACGMAARLFLWTDAEPSEGWTFGAGRSEAWTRRIRHGLVVRCGDNRSTLHALRALAARNLYVDCTP